MRIILLLLALPLTALSQNIQQACENSFGFKSEQIRCQNAALNVGVVETCTIVFKRFDRDSLNPRLACVELTKSEADLEDCSKSKLRGNDFLRCLKGRRAQSIHGFCHSAFKRDHRKLRCMKAATTAEVGQACLENFKRAHNQLDCMKTTFSPNVVKACAQILAGKNIRVRLNCSTLAEDADKVVQCGKDHSGANQILNCLDQ